MRSSAFRIPILIGVLALVLYAPGLWWGAPHATSDDRKQAWGVDDETPLGPLAEIHNIIEPKPDRNLGYPLMYSFMAAAAQAPYLAYLRLSGQWSDVSGTYPFGLADPIGSLKMLTYIAHLLTVLLGVGVVVLAYAAGRTLWDRRTGVLAALFALCSYPMFYYARTGNVDVPMLFFTALAFLMYVLILKDGVTMRRVIGLGVAMGFAMATKETSVAFFLPMPFVLFHLQRKQSEQKRVLDWNLWKPIGIAGVAAFLALGVGSGLFVEPSRYFAHIEFTTSRMGDYIEGSAHYGRIYPYTMEGHLAIGREFIGFVVDSMTVPGALLALAGVVLLGMRRDYRGLAFMLPALTYVLVLVLSARVMNLRYVMPLIFLLGFAAAHATVIAASSKSVAFRSIGMGLAVFALGLSLLRGIDLTHAMLNDSRYAAASWLEERTGPGDRVEFFGSSQKLPPLKAGIQTERATLYMGAIEAAALGPEVVRDIISGWDERRPNFIVIMPDHSSEVGAPYSHTCPPEVYEGLVTGRFGYHRVASFQTPPLMPWVRRPELDYPAVNPPIQIFAPVGMSVSVDR